MATNLYINSKGYANERTLVQDIIEEAIQISGFDIYYIPRIYSNYDKILGEDTRSTFGTAIALEAYLEDFSGPKGKSEILSKFGFEIRDSYTFSISPRRFREEVANKGIENITSIPREGDLLFIDLKENEENTFILLEIKFFENEQPHYQLGRDNYWKLETEMYRYSNEVFNTGIPTLDNYSKTLGVDSMLFRITLENGVDITTENGLYITLEDNSWHNRIQNSDKEDNDQLQEEALDIVDTFSVTNPFGDF
jgi:hypothetical protein